MSKIHIFTDADLDGAGSLLMLLRAFPNEEITYKVTTEKKFRDDILNWQLKDSFKNYDKVFICDLNIKEEAALVDRDNVIVFDHHAEHLDYLDQYKKAKAVIEDFSSCTLLMYKRLHLEDKLNDNEKLLVKIVDDYDSYTLNLSYSKSLNQIFWNYTGNRVQKFIDDFGKGFFGFNQYHKNTLRIVENKINKYFETEPLYIGNIPVSGKEYKVLGGFFSFAPNEISERALEEQNADFIILINRESKTVCLRRSKDCKLSMGKLASKIANGGGHEDAAGCLLNDNIINITKLLSEVKK